MDVSPVERAGERRETLRALRRSQVQHEGLLPLRQGDFVHCTKRRNRFLSVRFTKR
jgi:hypothetical protein